MFSNPLELCHGCHKRKVYTFACGAFSGEGSGFCFSSGIFFCWVGNPVELSKVGNEVSFCPLSWPTWSTCRSSSHTNGPCDVAACPWPARGKLRIGRYEFSHCSADRWRVGLVLPCSRKPKTYPFLKIKRTIPSETEPCHFLSYFEHETLCIEHLLSLSLL